MGIEQHFKNIVKSLEACSEKEFAKGMKAFFKEEINPIGVRRPALRKLVDDFFREHGENLPFADAIMLSEKLMKTGVFEHTDFALMLVDKYRDSYKKETFELFEGWIDKYITNWAHCDTLCPGPIGYMIFRHPELFPRVLHWTNSKNRWKRRAAAVSFVNIARKSDYATEVTAVAERLLNDNDDLVQKGTGWTLREAAKSNKRAIIAFLRKHKAVMPRTMLRYAIERFNNREKRELMEKAA